MAFIAMPPNMPQKNKMLCLNGADYAQQAPRKTSSSLSGWCVRELRAQLWQKVRGLELDSNSHSTLQLYPRYGAAAAGLPKIGEAPGVWVGLLPFEMEAVLGRWLCAGSVSRPNRYGLAPALPRFHASRSTRSAVISVRSCCFARATAIAAWMLAFDSNLLAVTLN